MNEGMMGQVKAIQIPDQITKINAACEVYQEEIRGLEERLKGVLIPPSPPCPTSPGSMAKQQLLTPIAEQLSVIVFKIDCFINDIRDIKKRLEV